MCSADSTSRKAAKITPTKSRNMHSVSLASWSLQLLFLWVVFCIKGSSQRHDPITQANHLESLRTVPICSQSIDAASTSSFWYLGVKNGPGREGVSKTASLSMLTLSLLSMLSSSLLVSPVQNGMIVLKLSCRMKESSSRSEAHAAPHTIVSAKLRDSHFVHIFSRNNCYYFLTAARQSTVVEFPLRFSFHFPKLVVLLVEDRGLP